MEKGKRGKQKNVKENTGKKILKMILVVLACIIVALIIYEVGIQSDGFLDKSNPMTRSEVISLLEKGKEYPNYYYSSYTPFWDKVESSGRTEIYVKDNIIQSVVNGEVTRWENYNTKEQISLWKKIKDGKDYAFISKIKADSIKDAEEYKYNQAGFDYSLIADLEHFNYNFKYLGEKEVKGRKYVLVKVWDKKSSEIFSTKFLIDKETGLITQRIDYSLLGVVLVKITCERDVVIDSVSSEDVVRPDLTGYEVIENKD